MIFRFVFVSLLYLVLSASCATAEGTWVLWERVPEREGKQGLVMYRYQRLETFTDEQFCIEKIAFFGRPVVGNPTFTSVYECLPNTIDPRATNVTAISHDPTAVNAVLYALSTIAQTCAALAALVGALALYKLQGMREEHAGTEHDIRGTLSNIREHRASRVVRSTKLSELRESLSRGQSPTPIALYRDSSPVSPNGMRSRRVTVARSAG